jgi:cation-transporting ATPase 13A1
LSASGQADITVRTKPESGIPCDLLLLSGTAIVNEAMLSGESTPLLKESVELRDGTDNLDMNGSDRNSVLFSGTKALQVEKSSESSLKSELSCANPNRGGQKADEQPLMMDAWLSCSAPASARPRVNSSAP